MENGIIRNALEAIRNKRTARDICETFDLSMSDLGRLSALDSAIRKGDVFVLETLKKQERISEDMYDYGMKEIVENAKPEVSDSTIVSQSGISYDDMYEAFIRGDSNEEIANKFNRSITTVRHYIAIFRNVACGNLEKAEQLALTRNVRGIIPWIHTMKDKPSTQYVPVPVPGRKGSVTLQLFIDVLSMLDNGESTKDIARKLNLGEVTIWRISNAKTAVDTFDLELLRKMHLGRKITKTIYELATDYILKHKKEPVEFMVKEELVSETPEVAETVEIETPPVSTEINPILDKNIPAQSEESRYAYMLKKQLKVFIERCVEKEDCDEARKLLYILEYVKMMYEEGEEETEEVAE